MGKKAPRKIRKIAAGIADAEKDDRDRNPGNGADGPENLHAPDSQPGSTAGYQPSVSPSGMPSSYGGAKSDARRAAANQPM